MKKFKHSSLKNIITKFKKKMDAFESYYCKAKQTNELIKLFACGSGGLPYTKKEKKKKKSIIEELGQQKQYRWIAMYGYSGTDCPVNQSEKEI